MGKVEVGIVGATGAVGEELVKVLADRLSSEDGLQINKLRLFASGRSAGKVVPTDVFGDLTIEEFALEKMKGLDVVFMAVSGDFALQYGKEIAKQGCLVIDNSSAFRYDKDIPLVIPEINGFCTKDAKLIANPNCTTAIAAMALWPLHQRYGIKRLIVSTYQAASGAGAEGMKELEDQALAFASSTTKMPSVFQHPLFFNVIPHIDKFQENGYTKEEMKVAWETNKIFGVDNISVSCTAVRIPTLRAHAEALTIETCLPIEDPAEAREIIAKARGVKMVDEPTKNRYPMPLNASRQYDIEAGRIRKSLVFGKNGLDLFVCGDQLLRGAALNAVLIAEFVQKGNFEKPEPFTEPIVNKVQNTTVKLPLVLAAVALASACTYLMASRK